MKIKPKLNYRYFIYIFLISICTGLYFYTTRNLIYSIALALITFIVCFLIEKQYLKHLNYTSRVYECAKFINDFIITLSINKSLKSTLEQVSKSFKGNLLDEYNELKNNDVEETIKDFENYFNLTMYNVFLKLLDQFIYQGGDIIKISQLLLFDVRRITNSIKDFELNSKRKLIEFVSMWGLTMLILIIVQLSMNVFYDSILKLSFYPIAIFVFFIIFLAFLFLFLNHMFSVEKSNVMENRNEKNNRKN